jgi:serine/threonine-protein kinase RsbT
MQIQTADTTHSVEFPPSGELRTGIQSDADIVTARQRGRAKAIALGFDGPEVLLIAAAISEIARNIVDYAKDGVMVMRTVETEGRRGLQIVASDHGPGIPDVEQALQYGYPRRRGIGLGLPGARWLVDEFDVVSKVGSGTTVTMTKWAAA